MTIGREETGDTVLPADSTIPAFYLRTCSPDGAIIDSIGRHLVAAYCSFIDPQKCVRPNWPCWLTSVALPIIVVVVSGMQLTIA